MTSSAKPLCALITLVLFVGGAASCGTPEGLNRVEATPSTQHRATLVAGGISAATVDGYVYESAPAAGADGSLWFWAASDSDARLFRVDASGATKSFVAGTSEADRVPQHVPAVAADATGNVWVGVNASLRELNSLAGTWKTFTPPILVDNGTAESYRPPQIRGAHAIDALAVNSAYVVTASDYAGSIEVFDRHTAKFSQIHLPDADTAETLAFFDNGTLAVGVTDYTTGRADQIALYPTMSSTPQWIEVPDAALLNPGPNGGLVAGSQKLSIIDNKGTVSPIVDPTGGHVPAFSLGVHTLQSGELLIAGTNALQVFDGVTGKVSRTFPYEMSQCSVVAFLPYGVSVPTTVAGQLCPKPPQSVIVSIDGTKAWALVKTDVSTLDLQIVDVASN